MGREEFFLWWLGITIGTVIFFTIFHWIVESSGNKEETNDELYAFVEKYFGKFFLRIFRIFI